MIVQLLIGEGHGQIAQRVVALWLTYLIHGLCWGAAAACLTRGRSARTQSALWRLALFGPLFSALLVWGAGWFELEAATRELSRSWSLRRSVELTGLTGAQAAGAWRALALVVLGSACLGLTRFLVSVARLRASLRSRREVRDPRLRRRFEQLRRQSGLGALALSESRAIAGPLVIGSRELCLSQDSLAALADAQVDAVFAHELAHLERRDGLWFPAAGLVQMVFWLHPSNALVAARMRRSAELACDDRALALTGDPLNLARALAALAERAVVRPALHVPTIAGDSSAALARVVRLLEDRPRPEEPAYAGPITLGLAVAAAGLCCALVSVGAEPGSLFDPSKWQQEMWSLADREQRASQELDALARTGADSTSFATRRAELEQELRHVRAAQTWTEQRFLQRAGAVDGTDDR